MRRGEERRGVRRGAVKGGTEMGRNGFKPEKSREALVDFLHSVSLLLLRQRSGYLLLPPPFPSGAAGK